jgi:transcriptional regulator
MYTPPAFQLETLPELHEVIRSVGLATLVTATDQGIMATPLPLFLVPGEGSLGTLYGHLARANPQWSARTTGDALVLFTGPDAYVTPSWYATKQEHGRVVPTWNYVAVHAYGTPEFFEDPERLIDAVTRLTGLHEASRSPPWAVTDAPDGYIRGQLKGIVGLRLPISRIEGKAKASQNRPDVDRAGVAAGLEAEGVPADAVAQLVRSRTAREPRSGP